MQKSLLKWRLNVFLLSTFCCISLFVNGQLSFTFSTQSGTYSSINNSSPTTIIAGNNDNAVSGAAPIGFTFNYSCIAYTEFRVSSNGWISLGNNTLKNLSGNVMYITGNGPLIAPLWDDLFINSNGSVTYLTTGTAGSRVLTVQWTNVKWGKDASNAGISFQVKLYEATGVIEFIYKQESGNLNSASATIGISGGYIATDYYSVSGVDASATATYGTETNNLSTKPSTNRVYRWTPDAMTYVSSTTTQVTGTVSKCNTMDQAIVGLQVVTKGCVSPLTVSQMIFNMTGTNNMPNVSKVHIYYTGDAPGFAPVNEFSGTFIAPAAAAATDITVNGSQQLLAGINYFWIAYDLINQPTSGALDAQTVSLTVSSSVKLPTVTNPSSSRSINDCTAYPGGILKPSFWIKGSDLTGTANNTAIAAWNDASGNSRNATSSGNNMPTFMDNILNNINFNPVVDFNEAAQDAANADYMDITSNNILSTDNNPYEVYAVIAPGSYNLTKAGKFLFSGEIGIGNFNSFDARSGYSLNDSWGTNDLIVGSTWTTDQPTMATFDYNYNQREMFLAGSSMGTRISKRRASTNYNSALGCQRSVSPIIEFYDGTIAEIITFANLAHGPLTRHKVESYLGIKYGVTLSHDYYAANSATVWSRSLNTGYNTNIIGIARDDDGALLQRQSKSTSLSKDILTVYLGTKVTNQKFNTTSFTAGDKSYFMVGSNNDSPLGTWPLSTEKPASVCCRIQREWLVQKTNFTNAQVKLEFDFNSITAGYLPLSATDLRLLVDDDGNFTNATVLGSPTITIVAGSGVATITVAASAFDGKPYFTLASVSQNTMLPIDLKAFSGNCKEGAVTLKWSTADVVKGEFIVERSNDRTNFYTLTTVTGNTDTYSWADDKPLPGTMYYRLKTKAANGAVAYSSIVAVAGCNTNSMQLVTDPMSGDARLILQLEKRTATEIGLFDEVGRRLGVAGLTGKFNLEKGSYTVPVNLSGFARAVYFLSVHADGERKVFRVIRK